MRGSEWVLDLAAELAGGEGDHSEEGWEERARAVLEIGGARVLAFDAEGFVSSSDYAVALEALAEIARPLELGPFEVRSTKESLTFRGSVCGAEVTFALPPITTDWFDGDLLAKVNDAIASRGVDGRFVTTQIWDWEILFTTADGELVLKRHPARPIWVDEVPQSDPVWVDVERPASLADAPTKFQVPLELSRSQLRLLGLTRHPSATDIAVRFGLPNRTTRAVLAKPDGRGWFTPEDAVDMAWSPDGATTYVVRRSVLEAWVWGRDEVRARYEVEQRTLLRVIVSPCGRFVALVARTRVGHELVLLETGALSMQRTHVMSAPAAVAFTEDGCTIMFLGMEDPPTRMLVNDRPKLWLGGIHFMETKPDGDHTVSMWLVDMPAVPGELLPVRFDGGAAIVDVPGWGEVRGAPSVEDPDGGSG